MSRFQVVVAIAALFALPLHAQSAPPNACGLQISVSCTTTSCTSTTLNASNTTCSGEFITGMWSTGGNAMVSAATNSLGLSQCFDTSMIPSPTPGQTYALCIGSGSLPPSGTFTTSVQLTGSGPIIAVTAVAAGTGQNVTTFVYAETNITGPSCTPTINAPPVAQSGADYNVNWSTVVDPTAQFLIDESTTKDFSSGVTETQVNGTSKSFNHTVTSATTYYYRVKATNCSSGTPQFSQTTSVVVVPQQTASVGGNAQVAIPSGSTAPASVTVTIPGQSAPATFTASTDKSYLTVNPPSGTVPTSGTNVTVTVAPGSLPAGTNTGSLKVTTNGAGGSSTTNTPINVSIVTPVQPGALQTPPQNALVVPIVTHVNAAAGPFVSDVRLTNGSGQPTSYLVTMAPAGSDATTQSQSTTITLQPQETTALNDIVKNFYGFGATGAPTDTGFGSLQITPINSPSTLNFASSRTYTTQSIGTFGEYFGAVSFSNFATLVSIPVQLPGGGVGTAPTTTKLSLQQVSHDPAGRFRANYGVVEGAGQPASGVVRVFDDNGNLAGSQPFNLNPGQVQQFSVGTIVPTLADGRIEVEITSKTGAVTAYASVIDNGTTDPYGVAPVDTSTISATRYVLPGISEFTNPTSNFHSDARIYNAGTSDVNATVTFYPIAGLPGANPKNLTIPAGHIAALDNILPTFFGVSATGGSVVVTTPSASSLVATANTYSNSPKGTYGQEIPGVQSTQGIGTGDRPLQILQLEQSDQFRSNVGFDEITGNPVNVEVTLYIPDSKTNAVTDFTLAPNEFRQFNSMISQVFGQTGQIYNARISVAVTGGTGRVAAYGSVIDNRSSDPTYVPAQ